MTQPPLRLLIVEDSADDAALAVRALEYGGFTLETVCVESEAGLREALDGATFDLVITDHALPGFDSTGVLTVLTERAPDLPCLLVSGKVGEEAVSAAIRQGAVDYVGKDSLGCLATCVERALATSRRRREHEAAEAVIARSARLFEAVFVNAGDAMLILDDDRRLVDANPAAARLLERPREELLTLRLEDLVPEASSAALLPAWAAFLDATQGRGEGDLQRPDGVCVPVEFTAAAHFLPVRHIVVMRDISERRAAESERERRVAQQAAVAEIGALALRADGLDALLMAATERVAATLGAETAAILELRVSEHTFVVRAESGAGRSRAGEVVPDGSQALYTVGQSGPVIVGDYETESRFERPVALGERGIRSAISVLIPGDQHPFGVLGTASGAPRAFDAVDASFLTAVAHTLAAAVRRNRSEDEMRHRALHDPLTGLPNRTLFFEHLTLALARTERLGTHLAVLFLDVDRFKALNDTLGHEAGDRLLTQIGGRIARTMRPSDTVARLGGDEFVVLCEDLEGETEAAALVTHLVAAFASPFESEGERHALNASVGVALSDANHRGGEALLRDADIAMYRSKERGRGTWTLATAELRQAVIDRFATKRALEHAVEAGELRLEYQPIVVLDGGGLCGVEALARWEDPERGPVAPGHFISIAEESTLILRLGAWVLREACEQAARWRRELADDAPLPIHVNLSARQVAQGDLPHLVGALLVEAGVPPSDVVLEITETALIEGVDGPSAVLAELGRMGVRVVLDDFGTGYSSLSYLDRFPIDTLKIDRAFVSPLEAASDQAPIVTAIIGMAHALSVGTVAEGVETAGQAAAVASLGCKHAQGYFFARPGSAEQITQLVRDGARVRERAAAARALASGQGRGIEPRAESSGGPAPAPDIVTLEQ